MSLKRVIIRVGLIVCTMLGSHAAMAGPVRCSVNNQDSTCVGQITTAWQTPPTCPTTPGYTTVAVAQWIGSQYSAPQCSYQAPPSCAPGWIQTGPDWNGSSWVNLGCSSPAPPPAPTIVAATGFWVWADCGSYNNAQVTGPIPLAVYRDTWSDGSTTYYQVYFGNHYPVSVDSKGRYYVTSLGDNWDTYSDGSAYPLASLYEVAALDPGVSIPTKPVYACRGGNH
jgi:hypothetical protein